MKMITTALALVISFSSFAKAVEATPERQRQAAMFGLKTILKMKAEDTLELQKEVSVNARKHSSLRFFDLRTKNQIARQNCDAIETHNMTTLMMLMPAFEVAEESLKYIPELDNERGVAELTKIVTYIKEITKARENCSNPEQSLQNVNKAVTLITELSNYLEQTVPTTAFAGEVDHAQ